MSAGSGKAVDPGHPGDLDKEIFMAWGKLVFGEPWRPEKEPPPDAKEIARILRLGLPVPPFVQVWLADLIDPPLEGGEEVKFVLKRNGRAVQKLETELEKLKKSLAIVSTLQRGKSLTDAINKVMPGKERQAFRALKYALRWFEQFNLLTDQNQLPAHLVAKVVTFVNFYIDDSN
jgi:hypothetical protein